MFSEIQTLKYASRGDCNETISLMFGNEVSNYEDVCKKIIGNRDVNLLGKVIERGLIIKNKYSEKLLYSEGGIFMDIMIDLCSRKNLEIIKFVVPKYIRYIPTITVLRMIEVCCNIDQEEKILYSITYEDIINYLIKNCSGHGICINDFIYRSFANRNYNVFCSLILSQKNSFYSMNKYKEICNILCKEHNTQVIRELISNGVNIDYDDRTIGISLDINNKFYSSDVKYILNILNLFLYNPISDIVLNYI